MADITNLERFLTDVANSIRTKRNMEETILAQDFDDEIGNIPTGPVVEKIVAEANEIIEDDTVVKVISTPLGESVLVPETGITEIVTDKTVLAEGIGLTGEKIIKGEVVLGIDGEAEGGIDTSDATATAEDIRTGKTAYANGVKIEGVFDGNNQDIEKLLGGEY